MNKVQIFDKHYSRLRAEAVLKSVTVGAAVGFFINLIFAALYWMLAFGGVWIGAVVGASVGAALGVTLYFLKYKVTDKDVARRIDREGLRERMITMLELSDDESVVAKVQRADAERTLGGVAAESIKMNISAVATVASAVILALSLTVTVLGILAGVGVIPYGKDMLSGNVIGAFDLTYVAGEGGQLRGITEQRVNAGEDASPVRAVADEGWMFVRWDDGDLSPERIDENITENKLFRAVFEKIDNNDSADDDKDEADDLPVASAVEESGGGDSDEEGGETPKNDGEGQGGGKWQDKNQFIDGATYYRDYLELYYQYATGIFEDNEDIPPEVIEFFETYFSGI